MKPVKNLKFRDPTRPVKNQTACRRSV